MDSRIRLDYALFQLTPTRTRCDLIICAGDCKEKLASGLLEPFISHLKFAKDEVSKGGYSITLSAPASASWFTKSTIERFVRFVSTPEVLERFVTIETELKNINHSINTNALSDSQTIYGLDGNLNKSAAFAHKHEDNTSDSLHEEDSKFHLQRVLESRMAVLQREQAMVYARALVVGFEAEFLQDLICFADAFGSPRLREACLNFMELCNTKSNDRVWMDEVAAMQAYSCSQYPYMEDDLGQELRINVQNGNFATKNINGSVDGLSDENQLPQYMHSYHGGPMFHPPYQGYPFPYYQGNLPWPPNVEDSRSRRRSHKKRSQELTQDGNFDSSDSSSESDSGSYKKSSSKKVIIRNINYITSADQKSDVEKNLDRTVEEKYEEQKVTQQWNIFQNLLMKDVDDEDSMEEFVSHKFEDPNTIASGNQLEFTTESSTIKKHEENDWYLRSRDIFEDHSESTKDVLVKYPLTVQARSLNKDSDSQLETYDSLMVSESNLTQKTIEATPVNEPNDLHMVLERDAAGQLAMPAWTPEMKSHGGNNKFVKMDSPEVNKSKTKALVKKDLEKKGSTIDAKTRALAGSRMKTPTANKTIPKGKLEKEEEKRKKMEELLTQRRKRIAERSVSTAKTANNNKPKAQPTAKNDKPKAQPTVKNDKPKAQLTRWNNNPKAQQTSKNNTSKAQVTAKKDKLKAQQTSKPKAQETPKNYKPNAQYASRDMKSSNKTVIRSSTIDRLSAARVVNPRVLPVKSKPDNNPIKPPTKKNGEPKPVYKRTKVTTKENGVSRSLLSPKVVKPLDNSIVSKNSEGPKNKIVDQNISKQLPKDQTKTVSETSHKPSLVLQKDITLSDINGGSTNKAVNSVTFKLNENISGAMKHHIANVNHEVPMIKVLDPLPAKAGPENSSSRKKWSSLETSSKALSGFKKLLSFGRRR